MINFERLPYHAFHLNHHNALHRTTARITHHSTATLHHHAPSTFHCSQTPNPDFVALKTLQIGTFLPFEVVVIRQGGWDSISAIRAGINICRKCCVLGGEHRAKYNQPHLQINHEFNKPLAGIPPQPP